MDFPVSSFLDTRDSLRTTAHKAAEADCMMVLFAPEGGCHEAPQDQRFLSGDYIEIIWDPCQGAARLHTRSSDHSSWVRRSFEGLIKELVRNYRNHFAMLFVHAFCCQPIVTVL